MSTGFNGVNIPDSPAQLNKCSYVDLDPVNILQDRGLDHVDVKATWNTVENADYCKVGDWYYSIPSGGATMLSAATCRLTLISDPFTSAGGVSVSGNTVTANFDILDGVTQRCTVDSDNWGEYTNNDPLITPQEPLQIQSEWLTPSGEGTIPASITENPIFVESTVDLISQAVANKYGTTYTDSETGETVTVPETIPVASDDVTEYGWENETVTKKDGTRTFIRNDTYGYKANTTNSTTGLPNADGVAGAGQNVDSGIEAVNALGIAQGSIIDQWTVPREFIGEIDITYSNIVGYNSEEFQNQRVTKVTGRDTYVDSTISPDYATVKNKRLLYGEYNKYGLITCAGNSCEFKPEDLGTEKTPTVLVKADVRAKGSPYYRFSTINGDNDFWRNCIKGSQWESVPLVYQGASGSALTRLNFDNERRIAEINNAQYNDQYLLAQVSAAAGGVADIATMATAGSAIGGMIGVGSGAGSIASGMESNAFAAQSQMYTGATGVLSGISNITQNAIKKQQYEESYRAQKANELSGLYQSTTVYAPTITFPYNADILRDLKGNGVCVYKYRMSDNDIARCDKLLTMYGYQTAEQLTTQNFGRRTHFDYVSCSTVSITGLPKWWCDEIATQLKVGVRVWHELPNTAAYEDNPIRS